MHSVTLLAKFTTDTTVDDHDKAREKTKELLLRQLKKAQIAGEKSSEGLFEVEIVEMDSENIPVKSLGVLEKSGRGFEVLTFPDAYHFPCSLQQSSAIADDTDEAMEKPGSSALWLGVDEVRPRIMAKDAARLGVPTTQTEGWIPYPAPDFPDEVLLSGRMHLGRRQVESLVNHLQQWLKTGSLEL